jgi:hypothetical protein
MLLAPNLPALVPSSELQDALHSYHGLTVTWRTQETVERGEGRDSQRSLLTSLSTMSPDRTPLLARCCQVSAGT